jgi:predicted DNA binding protein
MRRLVLEFIADDVPESFGLIPKELTSFEVLNFLNRNPNEVAMICRMSFKDSKGAHGILFRDKTFHAQVLEKVSEFTWIYFVKRRLGAKSTRHNIMSIGGYLSTPYELKDGKLRVSFLGSAKEVKLFIQKIDEIGIRYKVNLLANAKFSPNSPLINLTEKQLRVMESAYNLGYYDLPRKIGSRALAEKLRLSEPTLVNHRRKSEKKLLDAIFRDEQF